MSSASRSDMERKREEAKRQRANQVSIHQTDTLPSEPIFDAPRKIDKQDNSARKIKELLGSWDDLQWVSGVPVKTTSKCDPGVLGSGQGPGTSANKSSIKTEPSTASSVNKNSLKMESSTSSSVDSSCTMRMNGEHKSILNIKSEVMKDDRKRDTSSSSNSKSHHSVNRHLGDEDRHKQESRGRSHDLTVEVGSERHRTSTLLNNNHGNTGQSFSSTHITTSPSHLPKPNTLKDSLLVRHNKIKKSVSPMPMHEGEPTVFPHSLSLKSSDTTQIGLGLAEINQHSMSASTNKLRPDVSKRSLVGEGCATTTTPIQRTPPKHHTPPSHLSGSGNISSSSQGRQKHPSLQIKKTEPIDLKDLDNIFKEMDIQPPHTAIQTPVKINDRFAFYPSVIDVDGSKSKDSTSSLIEPAVFGETEHFAAERGSGLSDLDVSEDSDEEMPEEKKLNEVAVLPSSPSAVKPDSSSSSGESSSDSDSSSDEGSDSDSSSSDSGDDKAGHDECEMEEGEIQEEIAEEEKCGAASPSRENAHSGWGLHHFMPKQLSPLSVQIASSTGKNDSGPVKVRSQEVKTSPLKIGEIGHSSTLAFIPLEDVEKYCGESSVDIQVEPSTRSGEKASLSPDALSTSSSSTASSHWASKAHFQNNQEKAPLNASISADRDICESPSKTAPARRDSIKSGPGRPRSVSNDRTNVVRKKAAVKVGPKVELSPENKMVQTVSGSGDLSEETARTLLVRTSSSSSDVDVESFTPDPKSHLASSALTQHPERLSGVSKQLFTSTPSSPEDNKHRTIKLLAASLEKTQKNRSVDKVLEDTSQVSKAKSSKNSLSSLDHIDSIFRESTDEFKPPIMLSPIEPGRSPVLLLEHTNEKVVSHVLVQVPSSCGKPSIMVRLPLSSLRNSSKLPLGNRQSVPQFAPPNVRGVREFSSDRDHKNTVNLAPDENLSLGTCERNSSEPSLVATLASVTTSQAKVVSSKRKKENDHPEVLKKAKFATPPSSKSSIKPTSERIENEVCHDEENRKVSKRMSERRSSTGSTSSRSSHKSSSKRRKQEQLPESVQPRAADMPHQNGPDAALPFNAYSTGKLPVPSPVIPHQEREPLMPMEDRLEPAEFYLQKAKELKHLADKMVEKPAKLVPYIKSTLYFILWGHSMEKQNHNEINRNFQMYSDTSSLLQYVSRCRLTCASGTDPEQAKRERKLSVLILRMQSLLSLKLFNLKKAEAMKLKKIIDHDHNKAQSIKVSSGTHAPSPHQNTWNKNSTGTPSPMSPTPSPTCSIGSVGSQGSCEQSCSKLTNGSLGSAASSMSSPGTVTVAQRIHSVTQKYLVVTTYLVQCHDLWEQSEAEVLTCKDFFDNLDNRCGPLSLHSNMLHLVRYVSTALREMGCA